MPTEGERENPVADWLAMRMDEIVREESDVSDSQILRDLERATACAETLDRVVNSNSPSGTATPPATIPDSIGRFRIERLVGRGGMGLVFLAHDLMLERPVALKVPRIDLASDPELRERFFREARLAGQLKHPHLVPVYEAGVDRVSCYIASAWCDGPDMAVWLQSLEEPMDPKQAARLTAILAETIGYCHEQDVVHRDLKPSNILLDHGEDRRLREDESDPLPFVLKITDFGLARVIQDSLEQTDSSLLLGTPQYMAPEQAECRSDEIGPATDIYALGVILHEMLSGRTPYEGTTVMEVLDQIRHEDPPSVRHVRSDVPRDLDTIVRKCLQKRPEDRYASGEALADDLRRFCDDESISARRVSIATRVRRWSKKVERVREAGVLAIGLNTAIILWMILGVVADVVDAPILMNAGSKLLFALSNLGVVLFPHVILIAAGFRMLKGSRGAVWINTIVAGILWFWITAMQVGVPTPFPAYEENPLAKFLVLGLLGFLSGVQFLFMLLALGQQISCRRQAQNC